jgi:hypothetical protein
MKNIFLAFTPYHVLLSYSIALAHHQSEDNIFFIISDFAESIKLAKAIEESRNSSFKKVYVLAGSYGKNNKILKWIITRNNILTLKHFIKNFQIKNIYSCQDQKAEGQALFYFAKKRNKATQCFYIEDGSGVYSEEVSKRKNFFKFILAKLFYGSWWRDKEVLGSSQWIDKLIAIFPQFVRDELKDKDIIPIKKEDILRLKKEEPFLNYLRLLNINLHKLQQIDILLLINHSNSAKRYPKYKGVIEKFFKIIKTQKLRLAVKYHPREPLEDFLSVSNREKITVLPREFPIELFYIIKPASLKFVIGGISTSLLTAKWLMDYCKVISLASLFNRYDHRLFKIFKEINIQLINSEEELKRIIK